METPGIHGQLQLQAVETTVGTTGGTIGLPLCQQAAATHISVLIWQHPGAGNAVSWAWDGSQWQPPHTGSHRSQGLPGAALFARGEHPWAQLHTASLPFQNISLCPVFQAFPLEPLCCWWRRPGPFWVSMALEAHSALPWGGVGWLETTGTEASQVSLSGDSCSVQIVRDQLTVAKAQCGSNIVIRSRRLHR